MKLIDNARDAWRFLSVQISAVGVAVEGTIIFTPWLTDWLSDRQKHVVGALGFCAVAIGRLISQKKKDDK